MKNIYRLGIDIGGTFTDLTLFNTETGEFMGLKTPTVPKDPARGITNGLALLQEEGIKPLEINYFVHGMTIGLNTLLQRRGADIALFVTEGFRDILSLQRLRLPVPYDFRSRLPESLIPRKNTYPIHGRLLHDGSERWPLDVKAIETAVDQAVANGIEGIVVSFLHSYKNPMHEQQAAEIIRQRAPQLDIVTSSELWSEMREYERTVMASANLYIQPNVKKYFATLKERLQDEGIAATPFITQSNGGLMDIETAASAPVRTLFSGPAAGVIGSIRVAESAGFENVLTFDLGGTSADISIIEKGQATFTQTNQLAGIPIMIPSVSIYSIGAGGGSYAWIDKGGLLKIGPESVGSDPGPACYGKGELAALTDAFLVCDYLNPDRFAAGRLPLYREKSEQALRPIADYLGKGVRETADQMIQVAVANMYTELSNVMEQHGIDPRDFSMLAFGGAGPVTANFLAQEIQAKNVLVPPSPGTLSALGALTADFLYDAVSSRQDLLSNLSSDELKAEFGQLTDKAEDWIKKQQLSILEGTTLLFSMDARYKGQAFEIELPLSAEWLSGAGIQEIENSFHAIHQRQYGHSDPETNIEVINLRVRIIGHTPKPFFKQVEAAGEEEPHIVSKRYVILNGVEHEADVYARTDLKQGYRVAGPAIVEQDDTTTVILPGWTGRTDLAGNLIIERLESES
ncbi:hydantoinase/oxoprolinase family protein [Planomicrobium sp. CPCC 101110]|uniref:hydantoinase/oxoprolinase family protein n=1 Tax=Planomicrobium sp. CPCC 101110 TaxID=2599619 RepID=UPI0021057213|nr:hydantoinase/oxoprolinase family protein [Planomicrobium sp. CPCC 101110]